MPFGFRFAQKCVSNAVCHSRRYVCVCVCAFVFAFRVTWKFRFRSFLLNNFILTGTNAALPNWTIDDLLQMNGNETKANTAIETIVSTPTKRASLRTRTHQQQQQQMTEGTSPTNHKRPSTLDSGVNKRLKGNSTVSSFNQSGSSSGSKSSTTQQRPTFSTQSHEKMQQKSPHLLQHLMAPSPDRVRKYNGPACKDTSNEKSLCSNAAQWACSGPSGYDEAMKNQSTGSVLKNLLVSGRDLSAGYVCHVPARMRKLAKA